MIKFIKLMSSIEPKKKMFRENFLYKHVYFIAISELPQISARLPTKKKSNLAWLRASKL